MLTMPPLCRHRNLCDRYNKTQRLLNDFTTPTFDGKQKQKLKYGIRDIVVTYYIFVTM